jgi:hypothetical protein
MAIQSIAPIFPDLSGSIVTTVCNMQFVLPKSTTLSATREAGLVQIAIETASIQVARLVCTGRQGFIVSAAG